MTTTDDAAVVASEASSTAGVRELVGRGSVYTLATAAQAASGLLVLPLVTRLLDPAEYGVVAAATVVLQLLGLAAALGLPSVIMLEWFSASGGPAAARRLAVTTVLGAVVVASVADLTGPWWSTLFSGLSYDTPLRLAVWGTVPLAALGAAQGLLRSARHAGRFVAVTGVAVLGGPALGLAAVAVVDASATAYLVGVLAGLVLGSGAGLLLGGVRSVRPAGWPLSRSALGTALPTVPHSLALFALFAVDRVMVERYDGLAAAGRYQIAYLIGAAGLSLVAAVNNAWSPIIFGADEHDRWTVLARTAAALALLVVPLTAALVMAAPLLLQLAAPPSYDPATLTDVTVLVAASLLPYVLYLSHVHIVFFHRRTGVLALATPVAAAVNVALNVVLIPRWGLGGAALASLLGYGLLAALVAVVARRIQVVPWDLRRWLLAGVVGVVVVAAALALPASGAVAVTIRAGATVAAAAALLVVARRLLREERALVAAEAG